MTAGAEQLLRDMVRIRCVEEVLADAYRDEQRMRTPVHFSIGQEAVAVGVCAALRRSDLVYSSHRCHAHYLAKGGDLDAMVAELHGKETGCCKGRGGSVHLMDTEAGFGASSAVLGEMISVATGVALALSMAGSSDVVATFFGDGTAEEGVFHEALNFAMVRELPIVFVCENNGYSLSTPLRVRQPPEAGISEWARGYGMPAVRLDGNNVFAVLAAAQEAVRWCRSGRGPYFLELETYRWREHVGPHWDHDLDHRTKAELDSWIARCPIEHATGILRERAPGIDERRSAWQAASLAEVRAAIEFAEQSPFPAADRLLDGTYGS